MKIHLVTYATPRFRLRQLILGWSARVNRVVDTVTNWTPEKLLAAGFEDRCKDIKLSERGSGFWAWKAFIIDAKLREVAEGDLVFYCDVGRIYPFKLIEQPVTPYLNWMRSENQDVMPGVEIPWDGPILHWTKREALIALRDGQSGDIGGCADSSKFLTLALQRRRSKGSWALVGSVFTAYVGE